MDNICPYFKNSEEKHTVKTCFATEHMLNCKRRIRTCGVPRCGFIGNKDEIDAHEEQDVVRHNELLTRSNRELLEIIHTKPQESIDYTKEIVTMWSKTWKIDDFHVVAGRAQAQLIPLMSGNFQKEDQVWRLVFFPSESSTFLQLVSSPRSPQLTKATIAIQDCGYSFPAVFLREKEMIGGKLEDHRRYHGLVEIKICATTYEYRNQATNICKPEITILSHERNKEASTGLDMTAIINRFVDKLEKQGKMKEILARADRVSKSLPKDFGRGGKVGADALKSLDVSIRRVFEARTRAPQSLGDEVDDIVSSRYLTPNIKPQIDQLYTGNDSSNDTGLHLHLLGNKSSYISGSIIMLFKDAM